MSPHLGKNNTAGWAQHSPRSRRQPGSRPPRRPAWIVALLLTGLSLAAPAQVELSQVASWPGYRREQIGLNAVWKTGDYAYVVGWDGLYVVNVENAAEPWCVATLRTGGGYDVQVVGNYAYAVSAGKLRVIDVSNPGYPVRVGETNVSGSVWAVWVQNQVAYMACGTAGFKAYDVSRPAQLVKVGLDQNSQGDLWDIVATNGLVFAAAQSKGLEVYSVGVSGLMTAYRSIDAAWAVWLAENQAFVLGGYPSRMAILDVGNPTNIQWRADFLTRDYPKAVVVTEGRAYVVQGAGGMEIVDVRTPTAPSQLGLIDTPRDASGVFVESNTAYVIDDEAGLHVVDVSQPASPTILGTADLSGYARKVTLANGYAFLVESNAGVRVLDVREAGAPKRVGHLWTPFTAKDVAVQGNLAYVVGSTNTLGGGLYVYNIIDPTHPALIGGFQTNADFGSVEVMGDNAYIAEERGYLWVIDVTVPAQPERRGRTNIHTGIVGLKVLGDHIYVASSRYLSILSITNPASPRRVGEYTNSVSYPIRAMTVAGQKAYLAVPAGLAMVDVGNPTVPATTEIITDPVRWPNGAYDVLVDGQLAFVANGLSGVSAANISERPATIYGPEDTPGFAGALALEGGRLYVADGEYGLQILQTSTSSSPPSLLNQPSDVTVNTGQAAEFSVLATGPEPLSYLWLFNATSVVAEATGNILTIPYARTNLGGTYQVVVSNPEGAVTSRVARLTVRPPPTAPLLFITQPEPGREFLAPAQIPIRATLSQGTAEWVQFTNDTQIIGAVLEPPYGLTWSNVGSGTYVIRAVANLGDGEKIASAPVTVYVIDNPPTDPATFSFDTNSYTVGEEMGTVTVTVVKSASSVPGSVEVATTNGSAQALGNEPGDYLPLTRLLTFAAGERIKTISIPIIDDTVYEGDQTFSVLLRPVGESLLGTPDWVTVTIVEDDLPSDWRGSVLRRRPPEPVPPHDGSLQIIFDPDVDGARWRLAWEAIWRTNRAILTGLASGNYEVAFKAVGGYLHPSTTIVPVLSGQLSSETNVYQFQGEPEEGALVVRIKPQSVSTNAWQLLGEDTWNDGGLTRSNLPVGPYVVVFKPAAGFQTPPPRAVTVQLGITSFEVLYLVADTNLNLQPQPVEFDVLTNTAGGLPYPWCGQIQTDAGYGSGTVVKERVVLTAAHVVFNDSALTFVPQARWFFQRCPGQYEPVPRNARGWYVFGGYATERTNDFQARGLTNGTSSVESQNLDVAALYFLEPAGRGGYSGYLVSEPGATEWLTGPESKILAGYPMDNVQESLRGQLHATAPTNRAMELVANRVFRTTAFRGYPGMSGGPVCVRYPANAALSGSYYPAAVFLGGTAQTVVRAIDGAVADLIHRADVSAQSGENNTGGGIITLISGGSNAGGGRSSFVRVSIHPIAARESGGGWRPLGESVYTADPNYTWDVPEGGRLIMEFRPIPGWALPEDREVALVPGDVTDLPVRYEPLPPVLHLDPTPALTVSGPVGANCRLEFQDQLNPADPWLPWRTNILTGGAQLFPLPVLTNVPQRFYRAVVLPEPQ